MLTFDALLEQYLFFKVLRPRSQTSYRGAMAQLEKHMLPRGICMAADLTQKHILEWRQKALQTIQAVSWNSYIRHLRTIYNYGIEYGILGLTRNPFRGMLVRELKRPKKTLSRTQISETRRILNRMAENEKSGERSLVTPTWFWQAVNETFYYTGLRVNQILNIQRCDVDLELMVINARAEGSKNHEQRFVPIACDLKPWLEQLLDKARKAGIKSDGQLFNVNRFSDHYKRATMNHWQVSATYRKLSNVIDSKVSPHRYRHTLATELMRQPERNLHITKQLLGHTNIKTTLDYICTDVEMLREGVNNR